ncbi:MAG: 3-deoxy-D-manno-octulosonic acid transferase, partial [Pseudomonadota bacterium]
MLTQNRRVADNLVAMGADPARVRVSVNLKSTSDPLPVDRAVLDQIRKNLGGRPVWIASSTHPGEEEQVLDAHRTLLNAQPELCLVLVPRHPDRGSEVADLMQRAGLTFARRSMDQSITRNTPVYLADTLGETGTWYALSRIVFLGGSLLPIGGHNPFEPAQAGAAVLTGPHVSNFSETFDPLIAAGAAQTVDGADALACAVKSWIADPAALDTAVTAAERFVQDRQAALGSIIDTLGSVLGLEPEA